MSMSTGQSSGAVGQPLTGRGHGQLERVTFNLTPRTSAALERVVDRTGDSKTDALNRAVQIYDYLEEVWSGGGQVCIRRSPGDELELLRVF
jgi:hypothetical protein